MVGMVHVAAVINRTAATINVSMYFFEVIFKQVPGNLPPF